MSRATIYRNWPDAADLVSALLENEAMQKPPGATVTDPADALTDRTVEVARRLSDPDLSALLLAGVESGRRSDQAARSTREFLNALFSPLEEVLLAGVEAGIIEGEATELLADLVGPLLGDLLIGRDVDAERARQVSHRFLASHRPAQRSVHQAATPNGPVPPRHR